MGKLDGKVALVTGASRSLGKAISIALAGEGANMVLAARSVDALKQTESAVTACGVQAESVPTDVTIEKQIDALFARTMERFGRLDILINNAGIFSNAPIDEIPTADWDRMINTDLRAPFLCIRAAFRIMKAQGGGRIINIGSISAQRVRLHNTPYNTAKFGLVGLTHSTALDGREYGINCGIVHPGVTRRENGPADRGDPAMQPAETAAAVLYMACQPPNINVLEIIQLPTSQPYLGRG